ncbi:unnamed protein product [Didymodactylos carnosus]|uniref:Uncharacterized protein n=1 Tax=Didymodactylos carnosus TaxID=1234261 RepID=A0A813TFT5_9BILA|nr:unnamed protein product [Didymodactylos carnosus]CAF3597736.1 unnamed protein product [Didymodactylos carnosus]
MAAFILPPIHLHRHSVIDYSSSLKQKNKLPSRIPLNNAVRLPKPRLSTVRFQESAFSLPTHSRTSQNNGSRLNVEIENILNEEQQHDTEQFQENEYIHSLKVMEKAERSLLNDNPSSLLLPKTSKSTTIEPLPMTKSKPPSTPVHFVSTLSVDGQYAMMKTYEDTLFKEISNAYPTVATILPRTKTSHFRKRRLLSPLKEQQQQLNKLYETHQVTEHIKQAQKILDDLDEIKVGKLDRFCMSKRKEPLGKYVQWQKTWSHTLNA